MALVNVECNKVFALHAEDTGSNLCVMKYLQDQYKDPLYKQDRRWAAPELLTLDVSHSLSVTTYTFLDIQAPFTHQLVSEFRESKRYSSKTLIQ